MRDQWGQVTIHHAPNVTSRKRIGAELREVWTTGSPAKAETALAEVVADYRGTAPRLAAWLEENAPGGLAVFSLPRHHRRRMRIANPMERGVQQEPKCPTIKVWVFPNEASLERLGQRRAGRDRRQMGRRHQGLHQVEIPGCVIMAAENFRT